MTFCFAEGLVPPPMTPRVDDAPLPGVYLTTVKSPKSVASPVVAMVTYCIIFTADGIYAPALIPLVGDEKPVFLTNAASSANLPKSTAFPLVAIVTY